MKDNNKNYLMNTLVYDALKSAGVKEEEARAAAFEAGNNDLRLIALQHLHDKMQSHSDKNAAELRKEIADLRTELIENAKRNLENANFNSRSNLTIMLGAIAVGVGFLSMLMVILP